MVRTSAIAGLTRTIGRYSPGSGSAHGRGPFRSVDVRRPLLYGGGRRFPAVGQVAHPASASAACEQPVTDPGQHERWADLAPAAPNRVICVRVIRMARRPDLPMTVLAEYNAELTQHRLIIQIKRRLCFGAERSSSLIASCSVLGMSDCSLCRLSPKAL